MRNDCASPTTGQFDGLPDGGTFTGGDGGRYRIRYGGGNGNDVTLLRLPVELAQADLDGDGLSDLLWRNGTTGAVHRMLMAGTAIGQAATVYVEPDTSWTIASQGDFDGDGIADVVWRNVADGRVYVMPFRFDGTPKAGGVVHVEPDPAWRIVGTGDFDGDGKADLLWWNEDSGRVYAMLMNGAAVRFQGDVYREADTAWRIAAIGNFANGRRGSLVWRHEGTGEVYIMNISFNAGAFSRTGASVYSEPNPQWVLAGAIGSGGLIWHNAQLGLTAAQGFTGNNLIGTLVFRDPGPGFRIVSIGSYVDNVSRSLVWHNASTGEVKIGSAMGGTWYSVYREPNLQWQIEGTLSHGR